MSDFKIKSPWWKENAVGLAERDMTNERITVEIFYKRKDGTRLYPKPLWIPRSIAMMCPVKYIKGVKLRVIPIPKLQEMAYENSQT